MKKIRSLKNSDEAVAGIIVAILIIGLFISMIAFVQGVYVPQWMEQKEAEHMDDVANQFTQLKFSIDTLSVAAQQRCPISNPITLGSKELPFLNSNRAYGSLDILPNDCRITIINENGENITYNLGSIKYTSENFYYLDQSLVYETGSLILSQGSQDLMVGLPACEVVDMEDLSFNIVKFTGIGGKTSVSGYGTYPLQTKFFSSEFLLFHHVQQITIYTSYLNAWYLFFDDILGNSALAYSIQNTANNDGVTITFFDSDDADYPELSLKVVDIDIHISPGWIR